MPAQRPLSQLDILGVVLSYAVVAGLWILLSDGMLALLVRDSGALAMISAIKGWLFVLVTSTLLWLLLRRWIAAPGEGAARPEPAQSNALRPFLFIASFIVAVTAAAVAAAVQQHKTREIDRLQAIADFRTRQVSDWVRERTIGDAALVQSSQFFADLYQRWQLERDAGAGETLKRRLAWLADSRGFAAVSLFDARGKRIWGSAEAPLQIADELARAFAKVSADGKVTRVGPYRGLRGKLRLDYVTPLAGARQPDRDTPLIVLHLKPETWLLPTLQSWPVPTESGETLLFRRDGKEVLYLSELRGRPGAAAYLRSPAGSGRLPGLDQPGMSGAVQYGLDYRGVPVVGVVRPVEGAEWFLLTKQDTAELYKHAIKEAVWIVFTGLFALVVAAAYLALQRQRQQLVVSATKAQAQRERLAVLGLLEAIVEHSQDCIFALDREGRFTLFNKAAARTFDKAQAQVIGRDEHALFPPEIAGRQIGDNRRVMVRGESEAFEETLPVGAVMRTFLTVKSPLRDDTGAVVGVCGIARDISARKAAEEAARTAAERLRLVLDATHDGVWDWDLVTGVADLSPRYYEMTGYAPDEVSADLAFFQRLVHPDDWARVHAIMEAHLRGEAPSCEFDFRLTTKSGAIRWMHAKGKVVQRDASGSALRIVGTISDIADRKRGEEALQKQAEVLRARNEELERFNRAMIGRELDMVELKRRINALSMRLGEAPPFSVGFADIVRQEFGE